MTFYLLPTKTLDITSNISKKLFSISQPKDSPNNGFACNWWANRSNDFWLNTDIDAPLFVYSSGNIGALADSYVPLIDLGILVPSSIEIIRTFTRPEGGVVTLGELIPAELFALGKTHQQMFASGYRPKICY